MEKQPEVRLNDLPADEQGLTPEEAEAAQGGLLMDGSVRGCSNNLLPAVQQKVVTGELLPYIEQDN